MDHHCPWVNNCVGWGNYKYFVLFLFYSILYTMFVTFTSLKYFIRMWSGNNMKVGSNLHVLFLFFVAAMFSISLWSLFGFHLYLTLSNKSTLESFRGPIFQNGPDKNGFNIGRGNNFRQVFGNTRWKWFIPIFTTLGNGYSFRTTHTRNPEVNGLLYVDDDDQRYDNTSERDTLLGYEEPTPVYTSATFVNGEDIKLNGYLGRTLSVSDDNYDDDDEEVAFDLSEVQRTNRGDGGHVSVDMKSALLRSRDDIEES